MIISPAKGLALCRIGVGLYYLSYAWDKTSKNWLSDPNPFMNGVIGNPNASPPVRGMAAGAEPFYKPFLDAVVAPSPLLFSQLVTIGEWVAALLLIFGLLTRLGALTGIWLNLHYMLAKGLASNGGSIDRLFVLTDLAFLLAAAGLVWGLDGAWRQRLAGNALTRWLAGIPERAAAAERLEPVPAGSARI